MNLKAGFGVAAGILGGGILYLMLYFFYQIPALISLYITLPCTAILCLGMGISTGFRCVVMILTPDTVHRQGSYRHLFLDLRPVADWTCGKHIGKFTSDFCYDVLQNKMDTVASTLSSIGDTLSTAFSPIYSGIEAAAAGLSAAAGQLNEASYACNQMFTGAYTDCYNGINSAYTECKNTLDDIPVIGKRDLTRVKERIMRHQKFIAALEKVKAEYVKIRGKVGKKKAREMLDSLNVDFDIKDVNNLLKDILSNFTEHHNHRSYISRDEYDNIYITKQFREYDEECRSIGKRTVLPLKKAEKKMYIDCSSCLLTAVEFKTSFAGLAQLFLHMIVCVILVFFDYVFYYVVYLVQRYGNIEIDLTGSSSIVLTVEGTGEIATLLRALISDINIQNTYNADLNFTTCLPTALVPETSDLILYITLYLICFGTILVQAYGMRTRRRISAYFYPRQETERIIYLHKKIIFKRQGRQKFQFMHMKTRKKERDTSQSLALSRKVANRVPAMTSILRVNQRECLSCKDKEKADSVFYTCSNVDCYADYCEECYQDMNEKCVLCNPPTVSYEKQDWQME
ncbi:hypothetical protein FSP39_018874 [Pinctada imbricata]|uniref:Dendritic cell-specific transmembrane protein-like domain-containing protein n=1 Tax=Pinctada imbricata TaxID=66713 RepID=A0AA88YNV6_PINIB|nr:hypothetical protein FSP39_018874 [Pinctada imbricata]